MESIIYNVILKIIEQMGNNVWLLLLFIIILIGYNKFKKEKLNFIFRQVYIDEKILKLVDREFHHMILMFAPIIVVADILYRAMQERKIIEYKLYISLILPLLCIVFISSVCKIKEECNNKLIEIGILLLPGVIFYVIYIIGIVMAQKYICVTIIITIIGWIIPIILKYILLYMMSSKDNKMMLVKFNDGRAFNYYYKDVDDNNDEIYMTIKIRNKKGNVIRIKKVKKSDVKEKVIYNQKPKITGNYISMKKGKK